ncbi:hypothetical protein C8J56DRAFT_893294 [Mycena floridula]|nr:hypothetical protein C8J56DRAFT_893294 [Mycena floridula]
MSADNEEATRIRAFCRQPELDIAAIDAEIEILARSLESLRLQRSGFEAIMTPHQQLLSPLCRLTISRDYAKNLWIRAPSVLSLDSSMRRSHAERWQSIGLEISRGVIKEPTLTNRDMGMLRDFRLAINTSKICRMFRPFTISLDDLEFLKQAPNLRRLTYHQFLPIGLPTAMIPSSLTELDLDTSLLPAADLYLFLAGYQAATPDLPFIPQGFPVLSELQMFDTNVELYITFFQRVSSAEGSSNFSTQLAMLLSSIPTITHLVLSAQPTTSYVSGGTAFAIQFGDPFLEMLFPTTGPPICPNLIEGSFSNCAESYFIIPAIHKFAHHRARLPAIEGSYRPLRSLTIRHDSD